MNLQPTLDGPTVRYDAVCVLDGMLDGPDLVSQSILDDVCGRFPDSPALLCNKSGSREDS
ncbi:hypothetical protein EU244_028520 [Rhodococcus qingshengii]|uniref:hypothetical protein n=1 Tax=Rhodococcus qingshengii TaxID=334542 RepID=UPI0026C5E8B7|nr:hypothetical protein [Rhodococcus qingshengii]